MNVLLQVSYLLLNIYNMTINFFFLPDCVEEVELGFIGGQGWRGVKSGLDS